MTVNCPYLNSGVCEAASGVFYLPLPEHKNLFCRAQFFKCKHFIRCDANLQGDERRNFRRFNKNGIRVTVDGTSELEAFTVDLGLGGIRLCTPVVRPVGDCMEVTLQDNDDSMTFSANACVRWADVSENGAPHEMGLEFIPKLKEAALERLSAFLA